MEQHGTSDWALIATHSLGPPAEAESASPIVSVEIEPPLSGGGRGEAAGGGGGGGGRRLLVARSSGALRLWELPSPFDEAYQAAAEEPEWEKLGRETAQSSRGSEDDVDASVRAGGRPGAWSRGESTDEYDDERQAAEDEATEVLAARGLGEDLSDDEPRMPPPPPPPSAPLLRRSSKDEAAVPGADSEEEAFVFVGAAEAAEAAEAEEDSMPRARPYQSQWPVPPPPKPPTRGRRPGRPRCLSPQAIPTTRPRRPQASSPPVRQPASSTRSTPPVATARRRPPAELAAEHPLSRPGVNSSRRMQKQQQALAQRTFASDVKPEVLVTAVAQARREATPLLNTPKESTSRYNALTSLEPTTAELRRRDDARRRESHHGPWLAQRALEPTLDALMTADREPEPVDTRSDADSYPYARHDAHGLAASAAQDALDALASSLGADLAGRDARALAAQSDLLLGCQLPMQISAPKPPARRR